MSIRLATLLLAVLTVALPRAVTAQTPPAIPPNILAAENLPMVMLTIAKDHTMFGRAYTDYEDIDFDGAVDYTFKPSFRYYGYFDSSKCYTYSSTNSRYEPAGNATLDAGRLYCNSGSTTGQWSGNFLNWATMSRMDVLRKVLYGGMRYLDSSTDTTLELSFVPRNSQAIVKYYNGTDLNRLTPYSDSTSMSEGITLCRRHAENSGTSHTNTFTPVIRVAKGNYILWNMTEVRTCNWNSEISYSWKSPTISFLNNNYLTPANTLGSSTSAHSHKGQTPGTADSYVARVQACVSTLLGGERCKRYGTGSGVVWKPIGLLHEFGESGDYGNKAARAEFGLMMGSYDNNLESGRLRKNMGELNDEIDPATGQYLTSAAGATRTYRGSNGGIIRSLDEITLYGYNASSGNYAQTCYSDTITNGNCPSWGNPLGELLLESMLYYAGQAATVASGSQTLDDAVGLPQVSTRRDPLTWNGTINSGKTRQALYGQNMCRRLNALTITGGVNSFDNNSMSRISDLGSSTTAAARTKDIGDQEGVTGSTRLVGGNGTTIDNLCTGKSITDLGLVTGVCPDGPNFRGTYLGAGVAHYANTKRIRSDLNTTAALIADLPHTALTVRQYGVTMTGGVANIRVPVPGQSGKFVIITPASIDFLSRSGGLAGNMVDFKVLQRSADGLSGAALVLWQHNMLGEDQDQDMLGTIRWSVDASTSPPRLTVFTQTVESDTGSGSAYAFGYTLVGTGGPSGSTDGAYFHSGINNFVTTLSDISVPNPVYRGADTSGCIPSGNSRSLCVRLGNTGDYVRGETARSYGMTGTTDATLKEPLWFITKYGGFAYTAGEKTAAGSGELFPTSRAQWDTKNAAGRRCAGTTADPCDGDPDTYFVARRPDLLETSLREIFQDIVNTSNTAPAISSSQLRSGELKYVAQFDPTDGRGEIWAYELLSNGLFATSPTWGAHTALTNANHDTGRRIITNIGTTGVPFRWSDVGTGTQSLLRGAFDDAYGQALLNWVRGDTSDNSRFRKRPTSSIMGAVVNSTPTVQGRPVADLRGSEFAGYGAFVTANRTRRSVLWVGAGDGMLHAFDATKGGGGAPLFSYVPEPLLAKLPNWAAPDGDRVQAMMDGSPLTADVNVGGTWKTYLFATLGRGGKGLFALDVTNPDDLTEANAANVFLWQFTEANDNSGDLGFMLNDPVPSRFSEQAGNVVKLKNGKWALLMGNGVLSNNGSAALYIFFVEGPNSGSWSGRFVKIVADTGPNNGLSAPTWVDSDNDGLADAVYAGDLKGNVWKFDLSSSTSSDWKVAFGGRPLYQAVDSNNRPLAITTAVETRSHPLGGIVVNFSTGRALLSGEFSGVAELHGIYGVWERPEYATASDSTLASSLPRGLSNMVARTLSDVGSDGSRTVSGGTIDWANKAGWYLPFPTSGEMSLANPARLLQVLVVTSMAPPAAKTVSTNPDPCFQQPRAWINVVDPLTGLTSKPVLGTVDVVNGTVTTTVALTSKRVQDTKFNFGSDKTCNAGLDCARAVGATGDVQLVGTQDRGRIFWRELPGLRTKGN